MTGYSDLTIWTIILATALGTYGLRWSFLGAFGDRPMPVWAQRLLRYTAVAVLPAISAPLVAWPAATQGTPDPARMIAAAPASLMAQEGWIRERQQRVDGALAALDADFRRLLGGAN